MTRIEVASELLKSLELSKVEARINQTGKLILRPAGKVSPEIQAQCREYLAEIKTLLEDRGLLSKSVPCSKCHGSGREPSALSQWDQIDYLLKALMWPSERIAVLYDEIRPDEALLLVRSGGVDLKSPDGSTRTIPRWQ